MSDGNRLERLAERTRELLDDLDRARPELLSVSELNRTLRQVLSNQAAILESLAGRDGQSRPQITVKPAASQGIERDCVLDLEKPEAEAAETSEESDEGPTVLGSIDSVPGFLAREFIEQFDNRDKDYDKGLEKMNRWIAAGTSGTPFQWRGDRAYLNLNGAGATSARNYEEQLMTRMGFSRRVGRLVVPGLEGEVVVYERPTG